METAPPHKTVVRKANTCSICLQSWTDVGDHRLCCLKCGHLFGRACIEEWLERRKTCPSCKVRAVKKEIRVLFATGDAVSEDDGHDENQQVEVHVTERNTKLEGKVEYLQSQLLEERARRRTSEAKRQKFSHEKNALEARVADLRDQLSKSQKLHAMTLEVRRKEHRSRAAAQEPPPSPSLFDCYGPSPPVPTRTTPAARAVSDPPSFEVIECVPIMGGKCRALHVSRTIGQMVASSMRTDSRRNTPVYGVTTISTLDVRHQAFVQIHSKEVRDVRISPCLAANILLTASMDGTVKLTDLRTRNPNMSYTTGAPVWSCEWNAINPFVFYAGLQSGNVLAYDSRSTRAAPLHDISLPAGWTASPVTSLAFIPTSSLQRCMSAAPLTPSSASPNELSSDSTPSPISPTPQTPEADVLVGGLAVGCTRGVWGVSGCEPMNVHTTRDTSMRGLCCSVAYDPKSSSLLASFRKTPLFGMASHSIFHPGAADLIQAPVKSATPSLWWTEGRTIHTQLDQTSLARSAFLSTPVSLVCAANDNPCRAVLWEADGGGVVQELTEHSSAVVDCMAFADRDSTFLATMSSDTLVLHKAKNT